MKIQIKGELKIAELRQAIFEQLDELEKQFTIQYIRNTTIYLNPTNGLGAEVYCRDMNGKKIEAIYCDGPYQSAADEYGDVQ